MPTPIIALRMRAPPFFGRVRPRKASSTRKSGCFRAKTAWRPPEALRPTSCETAIASASFPPAAKLAADPKSCYTFAHSLAAVVFPSAEKLQRYLSFLSADPTVAVWDAEREKDELAFMLDLNTLYFPAGFAEKIDQISSIMMTPTYLCVTFDCDGVHYELYDYHSAIAGKRQLDAAKSYVQTGNPAFDHREINGNGVYSYFSDAGLPEHAYRYTYHCWEQDGKYFTLRVNEINADPNKRYFELCHAEAYPLFDPPPASGFFRVNGALCYKNADGSSPKGWTKIGGKTYYFRPNGEALTKNTTIGGIRCKFNSDGHFLGRYTGWLKKIVVYPREDYYYYKNGEMQTGWLTLDGKTYYLQENGIRVPAPFEIDGKVYFFGADGVLQE